MARTVGIGIQDFCKIRENNYFYIDKTSFIKDNMSNREKIKAFHDYLANTKVISLSKNVKEDEKSIAYSLTFSDPTRTLSDEEVMQIFNKIIEEVVKKHNAVLRDK